MVESCVDHVQVVVRRAEETLAAPVAGEQHRPEGILLQLLGVEQKLQVFTGGFRIADLELDRLPDLAQFAREDAAAFLVLPEYAADEKITPPEEEGAVLYLNVGHSVTNLSIIEGGLTRVVRDIFISGSTFTKAVMKSLGCDPAKAESAKHEKGVLLSAEEKEKALSSDDRDGLGVSVAVTGVLKDLVVEIQRSVEFYLSQNPERLVTRVVLCGGSVSIPNLEAFLSKELNVPVKVVDPFSFVQGGDSVPDEVRPQLAVAAGLALRRMGDWV